MTAVLLALRNLLRNRRRSLATLLAMIIGLSAVLVFGGYASNVVHGLETAVVKRSGHIEIQRQGYFRDGSDNPTSYGIAQYQRIIDLVKNDPVLRPMVVVVTPTLEFGGIAGNFAAGVSRSVAATGVDVTERNRMFLWNDYDEINYANPLALAGTPDDSVIIGSGVARKLQLCGPLKVSDCAQPPGPEPAAEHAASASSTGSAARAEPDDLLRLSDQERSSEPAKRETQIELLAANTRGAPNVINVNVVAADNVGVKEWDDVYLVMHLKEAQRLIYGSGPPQVTAIMLQLKHTSQVPAARSRLETLLKGPLAGQPLELQDYDSLNPMYRQSVNFMASIFSFIAVLIGVIVLFTVGNTMSTAVAERTVEIGTLRAIGLRRSGIRALFIIEGVLLGLAGAILGALCALAVAFLINHSGLTWTPPGYIYAYLVQVSILQNLPLLFGSSAGLVIVAALSAWWPAGRAAGMDIVDALRHA
jgi:putative ABC transport system permease protein